MKAKQVWVDDDDCKLLYVTGVSGPVAVVVQLEDRDFALCICDVTRKELPDLSVFYYADEEEDICGAHFYTQKEAMKYAEKNLPDAVKSGEMFRTWTTVYNERNKR